MSIPSGSSGQTKSSHEGNGSRDSSEFEFVMKNNPPNVQSNLLMSAGSSISSSSHILPVAPLLSVQSPTPIKPLDEPPRPNPPPTSSVSMPELSSEDKTNVETILAESPPAPGMFGWVKGGGIFSGLVEKTKTMSEKVITTLDPQMKEFIYSGGNIEVVVASDKENKVNPVREAFQKVFGHATVYGVPSKAMSIAEQPVGFAAGKQAAHERIVNLRKSGNIEAGSVIVSVESFLYEVNEELWIDMSCLIVSDPAKNINIQCFSQPTNVEAKYINLVKDATPETYPKRWSGFAVPIGNIMSQQLSVPHTAWQEAISGVHRKELIGLAATSLAGLYKRALAARVDDV